MKIYLIRHGETDFNRRGIVQGGGVDSDLNDLGRQQAGAFFEYYRETEFDAVYVSPLKRTHQTVQPWVDAFGFVPRVEPGLTELSWGVLEGKIPTESEKQAFHRLKEDWQDGKLDLAVEAGESPNQCWARLVGVLDKLKSQHRDGRILVCSHGRTSRVLLSQLAGQGLHEMERFDHSNTGLNIFRLDERGQFVTELVNCTKHLERTSTS